MPSAFRAAAGGAFLFAVVGCTTTPVTVKMLDAGKLKDATSAIAGPVFFMPTVEFKLTIPLELEKHEGKNGKFLVVRPSDDPKKPIQLTPRAIADIKFPLVLTDRAGALVDITKFEMVLNAHSVLTAFNREAEDKTGDVAESVVKLGLTIAAGLMRSAEPAPGLKVTPLNIPAQLEFTFSLSQLPAGGQYDLDQLACKATDHTLEDLFWSQNMAVARGAYDRLQMEKATIQRTSKAPFDRPGVMSADTWSDDQLAKILAKGVNGIPYRIPADHTFILTFREGNGSRVVSLDAKSPEGQPLLYAPIFERRFSKAASGTEFDANGALTKYSRTQTSAAKGAVESGVAVAEQLKADRESRAAARQQEQTDKYDRAIKLRTKLKERADAEAAVAALEREIEAGRGTDDLQQQLRQKKADLDIINIKIQALLSGIDLP